MGTGFTGTTAVSGTSVGRGNHIVTDELITAMVPAGAGTAPISVDALGHRDERWQLHREPTALDQRLRRLGSRTQPR
jgi:hypothetical protein